MSKMDLKAYHILLVDDFGGFIRATRAQPDNIKLILVSYRATDLILAF